ncbi:hypothetical protein PT974_06765 [Cladobotryum mycophilum]|uniref:Uncharacterized protein n=1 Tax=Cladobotryum mycophilum TaxID=491253 RepID=A0ABR0SNM4_9HYPO
MRRGILFSLLVATSLVQCLSSSSQPNDQESSILWTPVYIKHSCSHVACDYSLVFHDDHGSRKSCNFTARKTGNELTGSVDLTNLNCDGLTSYTISGKYDVNAGGLVVTALGDDSGQETSFTISSRPPQPTHKLADLKRDGQKSLDYAPDWTLRDVIRKIRPNNRIWLSFHIASEGYDSAWCNMLVHVQSDPRTAPFAQESCAGSNFTVSWGYMGENDGGIMTLFNPEGTRQSWFGWNHVNSAEHLNDAGPNPTEDVLV